MKKLVWIFGSSSDYSKNIKTVFESQGHWVYCWGRSNCDYSSFENFQKDKLIPDVVVWNANIEEKIAIINTPGAMTIENIKTMFNEYTTIFTFMLKLVKWLKLQDKPINICNISSSITAWPHKEDKYVMYSVLRSMLQQVVFSASNSTCTAFCVSPSGIDTHNNKDYAIKTVELINDNTDLCVIDLSMNNKVIDFKTYKNE